MIYRILRNCLLIIVLTSSEILLAQPLVEQKEDDLPKDYLPASFHAGRREALRAIMPDNSVVVVFAFPTRNFSNDVDYLYHQNPDLYYFSGYKEPHAMLLVFKEEQKDANENTLKDIYCVMPLQSQILFFYALDLRNLFNEPDTGRHCKGWPRQSFHPPGFIC